MDATDQSDRPTACNIAETPKRWTTRILLWGWKCATCLHQTSSRFWKVGSYGRQIDNVISKQGNNLLLNWKQTNIAFLAWFWVGQTRINICWNGQGLITCSPDNGVICISLRTKIDTCFSCSKDMSAAFILLLEFCFQKNPLGVGHRPPVQRPVVSTWTSLAWDLRTERKLAWPFLFAPRIEHRHICVAQHQQFFWVNQQSCIFSFQSCEKENVVYQRWNAVFLLCKSNESQTRPLTTVPGSFDWKFGTLPVSNKSREIWKSAYLNGTQFIVSELMQKTRVVILTEYPNFWFALNTKKMSAWSLFHELVVLKSSQAVKHCQQHGLAIFQYLVAQKRLKAWFVFCAWNSALNTTPA